MATKIRIVYTVKQFIDKLLKIIYEIPTIYSNQKPYNCGFRHSNGSVSWDCWNWIKTIFWEWTDGFSVGSYLFAPDKNGMGDWNGKQILNKCTGISKDFKKVEAGEYLLTGMEDHAGIFIGEHIWNGYYFNVAECSPKTDYTQGGCHLSYVDEKGRRFNHRGGAQMGSWGYHAKLPWVDYTEEEALPEVKIENLNNGVGLVSISGQIKAKIK